MIDFFGRREQKRFASPCIEEDIFSSVQKQVGRVERGNRDWSSQKGECHLTLKITFSVPGALLGFSCKLFFSIQH